MKDWSAEDCQQQGQHNVTDWWADDRDGPVELGG